MVTIKEWAHTVDRYVRNCIKEQIENFDLSDRTALEKEDAFYIYTAGLFQGLGLMKNVLLGLNDIGGGALFDLFKSRTLSIFNTIEDIGNRTSKKEITHEQAWDEIRNMGMSL